MLFLSRAVGNDGGRTGGAADFFTPSCLNVAESGPSLSIAIASESLSGTADRGCSFSSAFNARSSPLLMASPSCACWDVVEMTDLARGVRGE